MGLIRQADAETAARDALVMDFVDVTAEAKRIIDGAKAEAERIVAEGKRERDELVSSAYDIGHQMGFAKGEAQGREKGSEQGFEQTMTELREGFSLLDASWNEALASFRELRSTLFEEARTDLVVLATEVAERVTKRYVELDAEVAAAQLREAISMVLDRTKLVIEVHPLDVEKCRAVLPKLMGELEPEDHARIVGNGELRRGSVIIQTPKGSVDASIDTQVRRIVQDLLRDRQRLIDEMSYSETEELVSGATSPAEQFDFDAVAEESAGTDEQGPAIEGGQEPVDERSERRVAETSDGLDEAADDATPGDQTIDPEGGDPDADADSDTDADGGVR